VALRASPFPLTRATHPPERTISSWFRQPEPKSLALTSLLPTPGGPLGSRPSTARLSLSEEQHPLDMD